jgi:hypothetical protein
MTVSNDKLSKFFAKHKPGSLDALRNREGRSTASKLTPNTIETINQNNHLDSPSEKQVNETLILNDSLPQKAVKNISQTLSLPIKNKKTQQTKSVSNPLAIREQSVSSPLAIREQSVSDPLAVREQSVSSPLAIREQFVSNPLADPLAKIDSSNPLLPTDFTGLFSKKEVALLTLIQLKCAENCSTLCEIDTEEIIKSLKIKPNRLRNLISRSIKKGGVKVLIKKSGKNAFRQFSITKELYSFLNDRSSRRNSFNPLADPLAQHDHSSSSINITTTRETDPSFFIDLASTVDFSGLEPFGFVKTHIDQLIKKGAELEIIQKSIDYFLFDLEKNKRAEKIKKDPVSFFMGIMRNEGAYNPPENYMTPQQLAQKKLIEIKQREIEKNKELEKEAYEVAFKIWATKLTYLEKDELLSKRSSQDKMMPKDVWLSLYFKQNAWDGLKDEYLIEA